MTRAEQVSRFAPWAGLMLALLFWVLDAALDHWVFEDQVGFFQHLWAAEAKELWMRGLVAAMLLVFGFAFRFHAQRLLKINAQLEDHLAERTHELRLANDWLHQALLEQKALTDAMELLSITDPLTTLNNRRHFIEALAKELHRNLRFAGGLAVVMLDVDHFKRVNDEYGHDVGDAVLVHLATLLSAGVRQNDTLARWGGEEFILLLPETDLAGAMMLAENLRRKVEGDPFPCVGQVTASFGVAVFAERERGDTLLKRADEALYRAKQEGRNRVAI